MNDTAFSTSPTTMLEADANIRAWRYALVMLSLCVVWTLVWYASTGRAMVDIWRRSDTFAHGFIVPPIALWLAWRMRAQLATVHLKPSWWALPLIAMAGFVWLLGELAWVNALTQFALVALIVLMVIAVLGVAAARKLAFPLAFLFFAVPFGEFMMPRLMEWTADAAVVGLRLSGIPVFREGQRFVIPTGTWSVVEACSGVRYLIASIVMGTLYAYLTYRSLKRRLVFISVAIAVPLVANWLRAYLIVMLGHVSGNEIAGGVDHLIYGWLFFGVVIALLFWIGARWHEDTHQEKRPIRNAGANLHHAGCSRPWAAGAMSALVLVGGPCAYWLIERAEAGAVAILPLIDALGDWEAKSNASHSWQPHFQAPSAQSAQVFRDGDRTAGLFVAYYRGQTRDSKLLSSENVLVKSNDPHWVRIDSSRSLVELQGQHFPMRTTQLQGSDDERLLVWQWYWINGQMVASDYMARIYLALSRLRGRGDDAAAVIVYAPMHSAGTEIALRDFASIAVTRLPIYLRDVRDRR